MAKLNGKAKWITIGLGCTGLLLTIALTIGGCWSGLTEEVRAGKAERGILETKHEALKESVGESLKRLEDGQQEIRQDVKTLLSRETP